jgi:hypothetical protein
VQLRCYWKQLWSRWAITGSCEPLVCAMFYRSLFVRLAFFFWPLCCLSFLDLQISLVLIEVLVPDKMFLCEFPIGSYVKLSTAMQLSWSEGGTTRHNSLWEIHIKTSCLEPVAQLEPNFDGIVIGWSSSKIVSGSRALPPRWPPQCSCIVICWTDFIYILSRPFNNWRQQVPSPGSWF